MEFSPSNPIVQLCLRAIGMDAEGQHDDAGGVLETAWSEASNDLERFLAAYFLGQHQQQVLDRLRWLETALQLALRMNDVAVNSALPTLHRNLAEGHEASGDHEGAERHRQLAEAAGTHARDPGPFFHGTRAELQVGDVLTAGRRSNYQSDLTMNHVYFTASVHGAGLAAALAQGDGRERVYVVEPTGPFENDPNVTDKKFPGNLTRSYRTSAPLRIVGEAADWVRLTPEQRQQWRDKLASSRGQIIN